MKAQLAFYIAENGNFVDKAIAWWTKSKFSHVELVIGKNWYSTSPRLLKVSKREIIPKEGHWGFVDIEIDVEKVVTLYQKTKGAKYDWTGIFLTQFLPFGIHARKKWFCSEWCAEALGLENSSRYSPEKLFQKMREEKSG